MHSASSSYGSPCAACKFLRRKCVPGCIFAPYFPSEEPKKFANVHKIFGASNVAKLLTDLPSHQREDAVNSLAYEAEARVRDPVYGCVGAISFLERQVERLQRELDAANADLIIYSCNANEVTGAANSSSVQSTTEFSATSREGYSRRSGYPPPYPQPWANNPNSETMNERRGNNY